ncbi:hypothetical protein [Mycobacterium intracellulare]|uniref:Uncharacterized protein n=1 Tax=Mycobacterium intracellulare TaxID=1767 RepID=A0AAE4UAN0_MYCIT|nr:hypothetical protein [Mycobacterium intracellulare]MDV6975274.1 hypothetical protein [Mycobacterium intracellulare]MDV6980338.1 hypothetical protein [Mycobacterium intracellulare]MDV7010767.1 hypothetical protein [Mycobacterium intracellulare]MDV7025673.1 hypothetical protein [Mycobacterium intracellulare]
MTYSFRTDHREVPTFEYDEKRQRVVMTWQGACFELIEPFWPDWFFDNDSTVARFDFKARMLGHPR